MRVWLSNMQSHTAWWLNHQTCTFGSPALPKFDGFIMFSSEKQCNLVLHPMIKQTPTIISSWFLNKMGNPIEYPHWSYVNIPLMSPKSKLTRSNSLVYPSGNLNIITIFHRAMASIALNYQRHPLVDQDSPAYGRHLHVVAESRRPTGHAPVARSAQLVSKKGDTCHVMGV